MNWHIKRRHLALGTSLAAFGYAGREGHLCADGGSHQPGEEGKWDRTRQQGSGTQHVPAKYPAGLVTVSTL